jgi:hypothetical protein
VNEYGFLEEPFNLKNNILTPFLIRFKNETFEKPYPFFTTEYSKKKNLYTRTLTPEINQLTFDFREGNSSL